MTQTATTLQATQMSALAVARQIVIRFQRYEDSITDMKLQKLLYYTKGWSMALCGLELFRESVEAWEHGPVVHSVWNEFKRFGDREITLECPDDEIELPLLDAVINVYGQRLTSRLRDQTHKESPWLTYYDGSYRTAIPDSALKSYFSKEALSPTERIHTEFLDCWIDHKYDVIHITKGKIDADLQSALMVELGCA